MQMRVAERKRRVFISEKWTWYLWKCCFPCKNLHVQYAVHLATRLTMLVTEEGHLVVQHRKLYQHLLHEQFTGCSALLFISLLYFPYKAGLQSGDFETRPGLQNFVDCRAVILWSSVYNETAKKKGRWFNWQQFLYRVSLFTFIWKLQFGTNFCGNPHQGKLKQQ